MKLVKRISICVCLVILVAGTASRVLSQPKDLPGKQTPFSLKTDTDPIRISTHLYFADQNQPFLTAEKRHLMVQGDSISLARSIIEALIHGSETGLTAVLPPETRLRAIYIAQDKTAYVDLSDTVRDRLAGGVRTELFAIYAMANSLVLNISAIERVKFLIQGREAETLAGHIDLSQPFRANMRMIR